jgi:hypothetical protein
MKKMLLFLLCVLVLTASSAVVSAHENHQDWSDQAYRGHSWQHENSRDDGALPFKWHERHDRYHGERVVDRGWAERFPGLHAYRWHGENFMYRGHHVKDAVLFYNNSDQLVSVGFMHNGAFIFIRDDHASYENHDSFFLSIWSH